jgi:hypothetical protein
MSKQSDRKRKQLEKLKATAKSFNAQDEPKNQSTITKASSKSSPQITEQIESGRLDKIINNASILGIAGTVFLGLAAFFQIYSHIISVGTLFVSLVVLGQLIRIELIKFERSTINHNFAFGIFLILSLTVCLYLALCFPAKDSATKTIDAGTIPNFSVSVHLADMPMANIELTNDFVVFGFNNLRPAVLGSLILPRAEGQAARLKFSVINESSVPVEDTVIVVSFPSEWKCDPAPEWMHAENHSINGDSMYTPTNTIQTWAFRIPGGILPGDKIELSGISVNNVSFSQDIEKQDIVTIMVKAKGLPNSLIKKQMFHLRFILPNISNVPLLLAGKTNSDGKLITLVPMLDKQSIK